MIRYNCSGQPYIDPLHRFTADDWKAGEASESGQAITDIISKGVGPEPLTLETMIAAIEKVKDLDYSNNPTCFGGFKVQECAWMKGMEVVVLSGDNAYCWPDGLAGKEVKVIRIPEYRPDELKIDWSF